MYLSKKIEKSNGLLCPLNKHSITPLKFSSIEFSAFSTLPMSQSQATSVRPMNYAAMLKKAEQKQVTTPQKPPVLLRRTTPAPNAPKKSSHRSSNASGSGSGSDSDDENSGPVRRLDRYLREEYHVSHPEDAGKFSF